MKSVENVWLKPAAPRDVPRVLLIKENQKTPCTSTEGRFPPSSSIQLTPAGMLVTGPCSLKRSELQRHSSFIRAVPALSPSQPPKFRPCLSLWDGHRAYLPLRHPRGRRPWRIPGRAGGPRAGAEGSAAPRTTPGAPTSAARPGPPLERREQPRPRADLLCPAGLAAALQELSPAARPAPTAGPARSPTRPVPGPPAPPHLCRRSPRSKPGPGLPLPAVRVGAGPVRGRPGCAGAAPCAAPAGGRRGEDALLPPPPAAAATPAGESRSRFHGNPRAGRPRRRRHRPVRAAPAALPGWGRERRRPPRS